MPVALLSIGRVVAQAVRLAFIHGDDLGEGGSACSLALPIALGLGAASATGSILALASPVTLAFAFALAPLGAGLAGDGLRLEAFPGVVQSRSA